MKIVQRQGNSYRIPGNLDEFQQELYLHLIDWKRAHITTESGKYGQSTYDAILPDSCTANGQMPHIYPPIKSHLEAHREENPFRIHKFFYHMASSQVANINLFLPILHHPLVDQVLALVKPDFASLDWAELDNGYCLEYWGGNFSQAERGPLGDKSATAGTDADLAIAYRDREGKRCLWLIEHKLTEHKFTTCGGFRSKGRQPHHDCAKSLAAILANKSSCYYHDAKGFLYWVLTEKHQQFFPNHSGHERCPFQGGMNQLWRNQLLGLAIEDDTHSPFSRSTFSVVTHPNNSSLGTTIDTYQDLIAENPQFSVMTSAKLVAAAEQVGDSVLLEWAEWYRGLYKIERTSGRV